MNGRVIPGPRGLPLLGVAHRLLWRPLAYQEELVERFGPIHRVPLGAQSLVLLHDAELIDEVLRKQGRIFPKSRMGMDAVKPLLGESLPTLVDMDRWRFAHDTLMPLFTPAALNRYWQAAATVVEQEVERLEAQARSGQSFDLYVFLHQAMFRILMRTIFSGDFADREIAEMVALFDAQTAYISARYVTNGSPLIDVLPAVRRGRRALQRLDERVGEMIRQRQARPLPAEPVDMLDALLAARKADGSALSFAELRDNCMAMLFGGHETTAGTTTWTFGLLALNPDIRAAVFDEVDRVFADGIGDYLQVREFDLIERVLDESMRLYPMFPFLMRQASEDTEIGGYAIQAGESVAFSAWTTHRDPRYWPQPQRFDPERHTPERKGQRPNAAFLPFSLGLRRCIGERVGRMEAYLLLSLISRRFEVNLVEGRLPAPKVSLSIKPHRGMPVTVSARRAAAAAVH